MRFSSGRREDKQDQEIGLSLQQKMDAVISQHHAPNQAEIFNQTTDTDDGTTQNGWTNSKAKRSACFPAPIHRPARKTYHAPRQTKNSQKHHLRNSYNPHQSLNCRFTRLQQTDSTPSSISPKELNPQLQTCKLHLQQILKKLTIFQDSRFSDKQIVSWLKPSLQKQRSILLKLFFRQQPHSAKSKHTELHLQTNREVLHHKLSSKLKDPHSNCRRFVRPAQIQWYNHILEQLYIQKNSHRMQQMQASILTKMRQVRQHMRNYNNEYVLPLRKKPVEISQFIEDLKQFEQITGPLKQINPIHRSRFGTVNQADRLIDRQTAEMNHEVEHASKILNFKLLAPHIAKIALN